MAHSVEQSLKSAYAAEERAQKFGKESRMKKDPCYQFHEKAMTCLDQHDFNQAACAWAFEEFKACTAQEKHRKREAGREQDTAVQAFRWAKGAVASGVQQLWASREEPEPEWKRAHRLQEEQQQLEQDMQRVQQVLQEQQQERQQDWQQQEQQQPQKAGARGWFSFFRRQQ